MLDETGELFRALDKHLLLTNRVLADEGSSLVGGLVIVELDGAVLLHSEAGGLEEGSGRRENLLCCDGGDGCGLLGCRSRSRSHLVSLLATLNLISRFSRSRFAGAFFRGWNWSTSTACWFRVLYGFFCVLCICRRSWKDRLHTTFAWSSFYWCCGACRWNWSDNFSSVVVEESINELVGLIDLFHMAGACNNDIAGLEETDSNPLALSFTRPIALTLTELLAGTLAWFMLVARHFIVIVLCIDALVNRTFENTEDTITARDDFVELITAKRDADTEVAVNELFIEADDGRFATPRTAGKLGDFAEEPLEGLDTELLRGDAGHLDRPVGEEFEIHLLPARGVWVRLADDEGRLIKEALGADFALCQGVAMTHANDLVAMFELQDALAGPPERNQDVMNVFKQLIQIEGCVEVGRGDHCADAEGSLFIEFFTWLGQRCCGAYVRAWLDL